MERHPVILSIASYNYREEAGFWRISKQSRLWEAMQRQSSPQYRTKYIRGTRSTISAA